MAFTPINVGQKKDDGFLDSVLGVASAIATIVGAVGTTVATGGIAAPKAGKDVAELVGATSQAAPALAGASEAATGVSTAANAGSTAKTVGSIGNLTSSGISAGKQFASAVSPQASYTDTGGAMTRRAAQFGRRDTPSSYSSNEPSSVLSESLSALRSPEISDDVRSEAEPILRRALRSTMRRV